MKVARNHTLHKAQHKDLATVVQHMLSNASHVLLLSSSGSAETIFPPVFGRRLQAQVSKKGEKLIMEVEVTGLPEPTVSWLKDDKPIKEAGLSEHRLLAQGNSYKLIIERGELPTRSLRC